MPRAAKRPINAIEDPSILTDEEEKSLDHDMDEENGTQNITKKKGKKSTSKSVRQVKPRVSTDELDDDDEMNTSLENNNMDDEADDTGYKETGQIVKIYVENFMCHKKFTIQFCRHVNFITGSNGSGKSAIVSAVQLCLGATARVTGRGSSLAGFVKEGTDGPAIAQITLVNEGGDAYRPDIYGKRIIIERKITRAGVSSYTTYSEPKSLQDKVGAVVSHEKREVDNILRYFNIYVDNPCCVLTQEEAKKFIQGEDKEKYDFFLKASGLHRTKEELIAARDLINETTANKEKCEQALASKIEENRKLRDELELWLNFDVEENKVKALQAKVFWAKAYVCQSKLDQQGLVMQTCEEELAATQADFERLQAELNARGSIDAISAAIIELQAELEVVKQDVEDKSGTVSSANRRVTAIKSSIAQLERAKNDHKKRLREVESEIVDLRNRALAGAQGMEKELIEEMRLADIALKDVKEREQDAQQKLRDARDIKRGTDESLHYLNSSTRNLQKDIGKIQADIQAMNSSSSENRNAVKFGNHIPELLNRIAQQPFQGPVVGPLGLFVTLRAGYEDFGYQVERTMAASINSFVVTTFDDQKRLERIIQSMNNRSSHRIIIQAPSPRYTGVPSIPNATSVLDVIQIDNDLAYNTIIDQVRPENTVIVDDENDLRRNYVGFDANRRECLRDNISRAVTRQGVFFSYRYGNQTSEEPDYGCRHLFSSDATAMIQSLQQSMENKTRELMNVGKAINDENAGLVKVETHIRELERELRVIQSRLNEENRRRADFQARREELDAINNIDTSGLEREDAELRVAIQQIEVQHEAKVLELNAANVELNDRKQDRQSSERRKDELLTQLEQQETLLKNFINDSRSAKDAVKRAETQFLKKNQYLEEQLEIYRQLESQYQSAVELARSNSQELIADWDGEPIPVNSKETVQTLERRVKTQTQDLQERREELMERMKNKSLDTLQREYDRSQADLNHTRDSFEKFVQHLNDLEADYEVRQAKWKKKRSQASAKVSQAFSRNLVGLGFSGKVEFFHKEKTLTLDVVVMGANAGGRAQDVRQISGGERSYVALSFLLALGTVIESPFRIMDEYDVFLDNDSRNYTLERLQTHALEVNERQRSRQFFIITPHNLATVKPRGDEVKILMVRSSANLSARGMQQSTLDF